jgi:hypothetical protein
VNCQLSVSDRHPQPFPRQSTQFFLLCVNCISTSAAPRHSFCVSFLPPSSLDRYFVTFCVSIASFSTAAAPRHLVTFCVSIARFQLRKFCRQRQTFLLYRLIFLFFTFCVSIARFQLPLRIRFRYQKGHRHLGEVPRSYVFIPISAFLRWLRRHLFCSSEAESYCSVELGNRTVIERDNRVYYFRFSFSCSSETEVTAL